MAPGLPRATPGVSVVPHGWAHVSCPSHTLRRSDPAADFTSSESALLNRHPLMTKRRTLSAAAPPPPAPLPAPAINASAAQATPGAAALTVGGATLGAVQAGHARADGQSSVAQARERMREVAKAPAKAELPQAARAAPDSDGAAAARAGKSAAGHAPGHAPGHTAGHTALQSAALELLTADNECGIQTFTGRTRAEASSVYRGDTNPTLIPTPIPTPNPDRGSNPHHPDPDPQPSPLPSP